MPPLVFETKGRKSTALQIFCQGPIMRQTLWEASP